MKLNGKHYTDWQQTKAFISAELFTFLEEWFDEKEYVIGHTSGSTGTPKEIRLWKEDMLASAALTNAFFKIGADSRLLLCLSPTYIAGKMMVVRALQANAELVTCPVQSRPLEMMKEENIDLAAMVPMQVEQSLRHSPDREQLQKIRYLLIGGAPLLPETEKQLQGIQVQCYATYGMTETVSHVALRRINDEEDYTALGKVYFAIDERDCLVIHTPHLRQKELVTNDVVRLISSTRFQWLGRYDHVINSSGVKYFPETIEKKMADLISCRFYITSRPDPLLGEKIVLVMERHPFTPRELSQFRQAISTRLIPYEIPKEIVFRPVFRETATGKLLRE